MQVALALLVLLLFVGLAVDVGNVYAQRRAMQNAADAGALAGARVLCMQGLGAQDAAMAAATDYATRNGAQVVTVTFPEINVVDVAVEEAADTFFIGLIGIQTVDVPAEAAAVCGAADVTCGMMPIAFPERVWDDLAIPQCGDPDNELVIIDSDKICGDDVGQLDCADNEVSTGGNRAWLDFAVPDPAKYGDLECAGNCGAAALKCWIRIPFPGGMRIPGCIRGQPGVIDAAYQEAHNLPPQDRIRKIPLFDSFTDEGECPGGDPVLGMSCDSKWMYHITRVACVEIVEYVRFYEIELVPEPPPEGEPPPEPEFELVKALIVRAMCGDECTEGCASGPGGIPQPGDITAVGLIK